MSWWKKLFGPDETDALKALELACKRGEITEEQRDRKIAVLTIDDEYELEQALEDIKLRNDPVEKQIVDIKRQFAAGDLTENERDKEIATIRKEPYVNVISMGIEDEDIRQGYFELDWNDDFVIMLQNAGITGTSNSDLVKIWLNGVRRTVILQEGADLDYGLVQTNE